MKRRLPLIFAVLVPIALACGGGGDGTRPARMERNAGKEGYKAHFDGACPALTAEFTADGAAATEKYKGKTVFLSGTVAEEYGSATGGAVVLAGEGDQTCRAKVFAGSAAKEARELEAGGPAEFLCTFELADTRGPAFKDCSPYREK